MTTHTTHGPQRTAEPHPVARVISNAKTGVAQAALRAAKACGIPTGGMMPRGCLTSAGPKPGFRTLYGVKESLSPDGHASARRNVADAHATLCIAQDWGTRNDATGQAIRETGSPWFDVTVIRGAAVPEAVVKRAAEWVQISVRHNGPITLNVAGDADDAISEAAEVFLRRLFVMLAPERVHTPPASGLAARLPSQGGV